MKFNTQIVGLYTLIRREIVRIFRIWIQSLLGPIVTVFLYFLIFGNIIGNRIGSVNGTPYLDFISPGLIIMAAINSAYTNVASSFFIVKFQRNIEEMLTSPMSNFNIMLGFVIGGIIRGTLVAIILSMLIYILFNVHLNFNFMVCVDILIITTLFSLAGFINGLCAQSFDDIALIPSFIITPMAYLGGVFYTLNMLPEIWRHIASLNPLFYVINIFRAHVLQLQLGNVILNYSIILGLILILNLFILHKMKENILLKG